MSIIELETAKAFLDVIHTDDDAKLQLLLDGAEDEARQYLDRDTLAELADGASSDGVPDLPASLVVGILLLLQASYQADPDQAAALRVAAEIKLAPFRANLGA